MRKLKPIPKNESEVTQLALEQPYLGTKGDSDTVFTHIRANEISVKDDEIKDLSIGLQDIDNAVLQHFINNIKPNVMHNNVRLEVPVIYDSPERWKSVQKDGYYRDKNGKIMVPLIIFKRENVEKVRTLGNKLDANQPHLYSSFTKKYSSRNFYDAFNVLNNIKPEREQYAIAIPDYVNIKYSCVIYTYYVEQMNHIIEALNYASDSYWGNPERFKFNARIDGFNTVIEVADGADRAVKSTFDLKLSGQIIPEVLQRDLNAVKKIPTITHTSFTTELVISQGENYNPQPISTPVSNWILNNGIWNDNGEWIDGENWID
jgi:hypothetical protein